MIGDNGLIQKSKDAKLETRAGTVEDETEMWKHNNYINISTGKSIEDSEEFLQSLIDRKLITEDEIDRSNETITIKRKDGKIIKQLNYSGVIINLTQNPSNEKVGTVELRVTSVQGLELPDEETKKKIIKEKYPQAMNLVNNNTELKTFDDALAYLYNNGSIPEKTEEAFWNKVNAEGLDKYYMMITIVNEPEEQVKEIIRTTSPILYNIQNRTHYKSLDELVKDLSEKGNITETTEDEFFETIKNSRTSLGNGY